MVDAGGVVVAAAGGLGECVVGVVYELEFSGSFGAFGGVGGDAVGVAFECRSRMLLANVELEKIDRTGMSMCSSNPLCSVAGGEGLIAICNLYGRQKETGRV